MVELRSGIRAQVFWSPNKIYAEATCGSTPGAVGGTDKGKNKVDGAPEVRVTPPEVSRVGEQLGDAEAAKYIAKGRQLTDGYLRTALGHLPPPPVTSLGKQVSTLTIDRDVFARRIACLKDRGVIINTVDFNPSREMMLEWITTNFIQSLGIEVMQLKVLAKFFF